MTLAIIAVGVMLSLWLIILTMALVRIHRAHNGLYGDVVGNYKDLKATRTKLREIEKSQASMASALHNLTDAVGRVMRGSVSTRPSPVVRPPVPVPATIVPTPRHARHAKDDPDAAPAR